LTPQYRYFAWAAFSRGGELVAWDYTPNIGWLGG
jgi:hypothetical protein